MTVSERRIVLADRRHIPRGGRREGDAPGRFPNILVADSYDGARIPCVKYLDRLGFCVDQAVSGREMLDKLDGVTPHVVLVEGGLPFASVAEIVDRLNRAAHAVPIIVMTSDLGSVKPDIGGHPQVSVLEKPFALSAMLAEIRRLLRVHFSVSAQLPIYSASA